MDENDVKNASVETRLEFKTEKDEKVFDLKSDEVKTFIFKI